MPHPFRATTGRSASLLAIGLLAASLAGCSVDIAREPAVVAPPGGSGKVVIAESTIVEGRERIRQQVAAQGGHVELGIGTADVLGLGVVVGAVLPGGPADGRLREGDVILRLDGQPILNSAGLAALVHARGGRLVDFSIRRDGRDATVMFQLGPGPAADGKPGAGAP
jgi:S1-C subfamily serine protease